MAKDILEDMKKLFLLALTLLFVSSPYAQKTDEELLVSAAMSLKDAFTSIGKSYEQKHKGVKVVFNFAGSGQLRSQIEAGALVDVFAPASEKDLQLLADKKLVVKDSIKIFARNTMVFIYNINSTVRFSSIDQLTDQKIKKIAIGNPQSVPAGKYAQEILSYYKVFDTLKDKLVFGESVRQVLDYVSRGEVDAGAVYSTDAMTDKKVAIAVAPPDSACSPIRYPIAVLSASKKAKKAREFIGFVTAPEGKKILRDFGFKE